MYYFTQDESERYYQAHRRQNFSRWSVKNVGSHEYSLTTPNGAEVVVSEQFQWDITPASQLQSTLLWVYSLEYLPILLEDFDDADIVSSLLRSFDTFVHSDAWDARFTELTSRDHMVAQILRTLSYLLASGALADRVVVADMMHYFVEWATQKENYHVNNHGMMLAVGTLHALNFNVAAELHADIQHAAAPDADVHSAAAQDAPVPQNPDAVQQQMSVEQQREEPHIELSVEDRAKVQLARHMLHDILDGIFEQSGLCRENSPAYQLFYIRFLKDLTKDFNILNTVSDDEGFVHDLIVRAQESLTHICLPSGDLPPFGDGNVTPHGSAESKAGRFYSQESGFFVDKGVDHYFSMKCGFSSVTHKHCDDTSIYLWANGETVLADAGLYNYDWHDPYTMAVKSQRGHSGAFFERFDHLYPATLYRNDRLRVHSSLELSEGKGDQGNSVSLVGRATYDDAYAVSRSVSYSDPARLHVTDIFTASSQQSENVVTRLIIPGSFDVSVRGSRTVVEASSSRNRLIIFTEGYSGIRVLDGSVREDDYAGWIATGFGEARPAWCIELLGTSGREYHMEINLR
ncbi:MAG: heparinase II/III family protein [Actinomycetaceae bacterium]|nr:heparinase II/III family protein [Actinomycetaceae bacterium]MDY6082704.1 heparinase II/III family protein [Actinomycetaceae bacterium]